MKITDEIKVIYDFETGAVVGKESVPDEVTVAAIASGESLLHTLPRIMVHLLLPHTDAAFFTSTSLLFSAPHKHMIEVQTEKVVLLSHMGDMEFFPDMEWTGERVLAFMNAAVEAHSRGEFCGCSE